MPSLLPPGDERVPRPISANESTDPVRPQSMDRLPEDVSRLPDLAGSGFHMPPEVLGQAESPSTEQELHPSVSKTTLAEVNLRARRRTQMAIKSTQSRGAVASAAKEALTPRHEAEKLALESSMFTYLAYRGIEVMFSNTSSKSIVGVCSRSHVVFQTLSLSSDTPVISISSNSSTGIIVVAHRDGLIQTYRPVSTDGGESNQPNMPIADKQQYMSSLSFGKYLWVNSITVNAGEFFCQPNEPVEFLDRRNAKPGQLVDLSTSFDHKLLVAHKNQLAVFDMVPSEISKGHPTSPRKGGGRLLWTTILSSHIVTAKISGDGQALAVVVEKTDGKLGAGVMTFIHDLDDGSRNAGLAQPLLHRNSSVGMVYRKGPFLSHSAPVTRISFRGLGRTTSSATAVDDQGNDLLLTYSADDSTVRIFNQNNWKQLMLWVAPPNSRADWIRGSAAFSLGDLESQKKGKNTGSKVQSRRPSAASSSDLSNTDGINTGLRNARTWGAGAPTTAAGAWIAEISFRGAFPGLRLSRLSYMKRGGDESQAAHFESVAAILPAGSIVAGSVLSSDDMGLSIQGIWPAWNPWLSEATESQSNDTLSGSAMQFLGLSSVPPPNSHYFGDSYIGGTHSPPTELRIIASHPKKGNLTIMEFPLWGDDDFGAMELGSPIRSVLSLSSTSVFAGNDEFTYDSTDYDSSRLCAYIDPGQRSMSLWWRKQGSHSLFSPEFVKDDSILLESISETAAPPLPQWLQDRSIVPAPLALPPLYLPNETVSLDNEEIVAIKWWPDCSYDGPPLLLTVTSSATLLLFEIPPPRSFHEPAMPNFDPFTISSSASMEDVGQSGCSASEEEDDNELARKEYEVGVTPHPDFGLGLRLESPMDGLPAVAGSFKKHPLNGGMLPAERTGMIFLGDEVLSVNGVSLENMTFDDVIATVRHVGTEAGPGQPLFLKFRPSASSRSRKNSAVLLDSYNVRQHQEVSRAESDATSSRRPVIGLRPKAHVREDCEINQQPSSDDGNPARMLGGTVGKVQQEFGRVIALIKNALPSVTGEDFCNRFLVLPWGDGIGAPVLSKLRGASLILLAEGHELHAMRLELPINAEPEKVRMYELGVFDLGGDGEGKEIPPTIRCIETVECTRDSRCFAITDMLGSVRMVIVHFSEKAGTKNGDANSIETSFRHYKLFDLGNDANLFRIIPGSINLFCSYEKSQDAAFRSILKLWTSRADPSCRERGDVASLKDDYFDQHYVSTEIEAIPSDSSNASIVEASFIKTGCLDTFPTLIVFLIAEAIVYQRRGGSEKWLPILRIAFPQIPCSSLAGSDLDDLSRHYPRDAYPHFLPMIQSALGSHDENKYLLSDWHPEALLAHLFTDDRGAKFSMRNHIRKVLLWVANTMDDPSHSKLQSIQGPLFVARISSLDSSQSPTSLSSDDDDHTTDFHGSFHRGKQGNQLVGDNEKTKLQSLLSALGQRKNFDPQVNTLGKSREFVLAMSKHNNSKENRDESNRFPSVLTSLSRTEMRVLWAIVDVTTNTPNYGRLDPAGQHALTIYAIHKAMKASPNDTSKTNTKPVSPYYKTNVSFFGRRTSLQEANEKARLPPKSASAGCVAALLTGYQSQLLDLIREPGEKLDWATVRELQVPFWVRSDKKLRQISEEVGQKLYRSSRDILKAAIFFLAAGKKRTLRNLAAADGTASGKKFFKFLTSFDFSSERGRSAAEKNAFSLLSKNKYDCAAAFFLLAEPPMLKPAIEIIASKMEDHDLAFMVARLIGDSKSIDEHASLSFGSGGGGFGSTIGGGGGYAGGGFSDLSQVKKDSESFEDWKPDLSENTKAFLIDRVLPAVQEDASFVAALYLWLGRKDDAWHWLSGFIGRPDGSCARFLNHVNLRRLHDVAPGMQKSQDPTLTMVNLLINFCSGPFLLKAMGAANRTTVASALLVSSCLCRMGIELSALRSLSQNAGPSMFEKSKKSLKKKPKEGSFAVTSQAAKTSVSSRFDKEHEVIAGGTKTSDYALRSHSGALDTPQKVLADSSAKDGAKSSIFDSFEPASNGKKSTATSGAIQSSIFDAYDVPSVAKSDSSQKDRSSVASGAMASSIFDAYDIPPIQTSKPTQETKQNSIADGTMASSIFDAYDTPPIHQTQRAPTNGMMTSSIFESYETAPTPKTGPKLATRKGSNVNYEGKQSATYAFESASGQPAVTKKAEPSEALSSPIREIPPIWKEWRQQIFMKSAARRVIREVASLGSRFHIDALQPVLSPSGRLDSPLIPRDAVQLLQFHVDGDELLSEIKDSLKSISALFQIEVIELVDEGLRMIETPFGFQRVMCAVLLHLAINREDSAEDVVRKTANSLIEKCNLLAFSNDKFAVSRQSVAHLSTLKIKQMAAHLTWQLELCLWMHRGGLLPLSGLALNESICAVRIGLLIASWNRDYEVLENIIRHPPDCLSDNAMGRQLWTSLKVISNPHLGERRASGTNSGGWEFLVDCRRAEATEMLRSRSTGCFIIRPHPEDHGVFTLSFKTNLVPTGDTDAGSSELKEGKDPDNSKKSKPGGSRAIKRDDVVQHAIIRLSDSGFRCGSFGPFATLIKLLEAVSTSLPFNLRFDKPPNEGVIKEEGSKPSPNSALFRKLGLLGGKRCPPNVYFESETELRDAGSMRENAGPENKKSISTPDLDSTVIEKIERRKYFGLFIELLVLSEVRKQLSGIAAAKYDNNAWVEEFDNESATSSNDNDEGGLEQDYSVAARLLRPLLTWCRMIEVRIVPLFAPLLDGSPSSLATIPIALDEKETGIEISTTETPPRLDGDDAVIRRVIQPGSGVGFRTLRLGDGAGESAMVVLFNRDEAVDWFLRNRVEQTEEGAAKRLEMMERSRVIEPVDMKIVAPKAYKKAQQENSDEESHAVIDILSKGIRYRLVDPWEVEPLESREAETRGASLGRRSYLAFGLGKVTDSCEDLLHSIGGAELLGLWTTTRGGAVLTKAIATVHPPWERASGGDLQLTNGNSAEPVAFDNSIRQHLYRNSLFRRLGLPQRFMALIQVELLDLKNLTSPGGSLSLTVYSLLRLKRPRSTAPLTMKARTLDSVATHPMKLGKSSGPNAPASWGSLVRFRFPLPEETAVDGRSYDGDREALFKGPPSVLQISVYEKKFMSDTLLGGADVKLDGLSSGGQLEEWVPLRTETHGINWFARIRLTLRFELMCICDNIEMGGLSELSPSVGLKRIRQLGSIGDMQEDLRKSSSTPDLLSYFESMVY